MLNSYHSRNEDDYLMQQREESPQTRARNLSPRGLQQALQEQVSSNNSKSTGEQDEDFSQVDREVSDISPSSLQRQSPHHQLQRLPLSEYPVSNEQLKELGLAALE